MAKIITLGEIMLRLSTATGQRLATSSHLAAHYGGGEANVAISLAHFEHQVSFASKVPQNFLGEAVKKHLLGNQVNIAPLLFGGDRLGSYYLESGSDLRAAAVIYDRRYSSFAEVTTNEWGTDLFEGVDLFHLSGITPALSPAWQALVLELVALAKAAGAKVSFDINYRGKLWSTAEMAEFLPKILPLVDYCSAGKLDAQVFMGVEKAAADLDATAEMRYYYTQMQALYPNIAVFFSTHRHVHSTEQNDLQGTLWYQGDLYESRAYSLKAIVDRVGGGDAYSAGILHGLLSGYDGQQTVEFGTAAAVLKHTVSGDDNQFSAAEVTAFASSTSSKINR